MSNLPKSARILMGVLVLSLLLGGAAAPSGAAQNSSTEFQQLIEQTNSRVPVYGPANGDLPFGLFEGCPECTWSTGLNLSDVRIHLDLIWPAASLTSGTLFIAVRQTDPEVQSVVEPNFFVVTPASWSAGGEVGSLDSVPAAIDIVAIGDTGYLAIDGSLVGTADLSGVTNPGDVILTSVAFDFSTPPAVSILKFSVWDLAVEGPSFQLQPGSSANTEAEAFQAYRLAALAQSAVYGPESGALIHDPERITLYDSAVTISDFSARVECVAPNLPAGAYWDCGFIFRDVNSNAHYKLGIVSDGSWFFERGSGDEVIEGVLDPTVDLTGGRMTIDVIAVGPKGYFAVNEVFGSALDLSALPGPGTVAIATSFYEQTYVAGGTTEFVDFTIYPIDADAQQEPGEQRHPRSGAARSSGETGGSYSDTNFGYSLTWDHTWTIVDPVPGQPEHLLRLTNGPVTADVYGQPGGTDATTCVNNLLEFYQSTEGYSNAAFVLDDDGNQVLSAGSDAALGLLTFTFVTAEGAESTVYDYVLCSTSIDRQSMVVIQQYVLPDDFPTQIEAMNQLQLGLRFDDVSGEPGLPDPGLVAPEEGTYVDPTYGYRLTWDATWSLQPGSENPEAGRLILTREQATVVLSAYESTASTATGCFEEVIQSHLGDPAYSNVRIVVNDVGLPIMTEGEYVATALLQYGANNSGSTAIHYDYVLCVKMRDSDVMVLMEAFLPADVFIHLKPELEALQGGLWIVQEKPISPPGLPGLNFSVLPVSEADRATFDQLMTASDAQAPSVGPAEVDLIMQGAEYATWSAGLSVNDIRVHVELAPPAGAIDSDWEFEIDFRSAGFGRDSLYLGSDGVFSSNGIDGYRDNVPATIDLIAVGDIAYLGFDGELIGLVDISTWMQPGDIVLSAVNSSQPAGTSRMHLSNVKIWDLGGLE